MGLLGGRHYSLNASAWEWSYVSSVITYQTHWNRNIAVTSQWLKSPETRLFVQPFVYAYIKENIKAREV